MARFLGIDWDSHQLHIVASTTGRGGVRIDAAVVLPGDFTPQLAQAEAIGLRLREQLNAANIAPAPVVVCIGRDRVIAKELRYPPVPLNEEPAVVRFQASKEMAEAAEGVVIDYTAKGDGHGPVGDRTALVFAVRRDLPVFFQAVCRAAGLKLLALTPRGFGVAGCMKRAATLASPAPEPGAVVAVLTVAEHWADFSVVRGDGVLYTRALPGTAHLIAEVRRNLALYNGQLPASAGARDKVHAVYVAGNGEHALLREQMQHTVTIPVHPLDPFSREPQLEPSGPRGGFAAAVGLVETWAKANKTPVNFIRPKEPVKAADPNQRRNLIIGAAVAAGLLFLVIGGWLLISSKRSQFERLVAEGREFDDTLTRLGPDAKHIAALKDWDSKKVSWLDELYEVTARFDMRDGFHLTEFKGEPRLHQAARGPGPKKAEKYAATMLLFGEARPKDEPSIKALALAINDATHRAYPERIIVGPGTGSNTKTEVKLFTLKADVAGLPSRKYTTEFTPPAAAQQPGYGGPPAAEEGDDGEGGLQ